MSLLFSLVNVYHHWYTIKANHQSEPFLVRMHSFLTFSDTHEMIPNSSSVSTGKDTKLAPRIETTRIQGPFFTGQHTLLKGIMHKIHTYQCYSFSMSSEFSHSVSAMGVQRKYELVKAGHQGRYLKLSSTTKHQLLSSSTCRHILYGPYLL